MEEFLNGYCRAADGARTVCVDMEEGSADCAFPACLYAASCPIAEKIRETLGKRP